MQTMRRTSQQNVMHNGLVCDGRVQGFLESREHHDHPSGGGTSM